LIAAGANIALTNSDDATALQIASSKGFQEIVQLLTAAEKNRDAKAKSENTSLKLSNNQ
jgi:ankyrin repeat protein